MDERMNDATFSTCDYVVKCEHMQRKYFEKCRKNLLECKDKLDKLTHTTNFHKMFDEHTAMLTENVYLITEARKLQ